MRNLALLAFLAMLHGTTYAFDLESLQMQLRAAHVVRGEFVQKKFLRSLERPLTSRGSFTLSQTHGLLWLLRSPFKQDLRMTQARGVAKRDDEGRWQAAPRNMHSDHHVRLFLAVLAGNADVLKKHFNIAVQGDSQAWQMTMVPNSALLRQVFETIVIQGDTFVRRIELRETQGDRTVVELENLQATDHVTPEEARAYLP